MKKEIAATNKRAKEARERISALSEEHNQIHTKGAEARAALAAVGGEPQATDFEDSNSWSRAVFDWRRAHMKETQAVQESENEARQHEIAAEIESANAEIAAAENERMGLVAEHFATQADELAGQLHASLLKFEATRDHNRDYGLKNLKTWKAVNYYGVHTVETSMVSPAVIDFSPHALAAEIN
jgi:hypothetical protein